MRLIRLLTLLLLAAPSLGAQQRLSADAEVRASPTGNVVATLRSGTTWTVGTARGGWTPLTIQGWVESSRLAGPREEFPQSIAQETNGWRIREQPSLNGRILGEFRGGAGLRVLERRENWVRIRREVWVQTSRLERATGAAAAQPTAPSAAAPVPASPAGTSAAPQTPPAAGGTAGSARAGAVRASGATSLRAGPAGEAIGSLNAGAVATPLARDRGWVKISVEAWVPDSLLTPTDSAFEATLSAADLRLRPDENRGKVVRWEVQVVGLQYADPLRRDLADGEPFLLAIGPRGEGAILYLAVPASLIEQAKAISPMSTLTLTARVRNGRSLPTGAPVLDILTMNSK